MARPKTGPYAASSRRFSPPKASVPDPDDHEANVRLLLRHLGHARKEVNGYVCCVPCGVALYEGAIPDVILEAMGRGG